MERFWVRLALGLMLVMGWSGPAAADWKSDIGYTKLKAELGAQLPTGAGVPVTQVEAAGSNGSYLPGTNSEFTGKTFTPTLDPNNVSGHATAVGQNFYGNSSSLAPGITNISCYEASDWTGTGFLNVFHICPFGLQQPGGEPQLGW